tara:strand:- start:1370 stop:1786 length:417 start_codon:yes stop_codon:yes gene_type:complete
MKIVKFNLIRRLSCDTKNYFGKNIKNISHAKNHVHGKNSNIPFKSSSKVKISDIGKHKICAGAASCGAACSAAGASCIVSSNINTDSPCNSIGGDCNSMRTDYRVLNNDIKIVHDDVIDDDNINDAHVSYDWWEATFR